MDTPPRGAPKRSIVLMECNTGILTCFFTGVCGDWRRCTLLSFVRDCRPVSGVSGRVSEVVLPCA